MKKTITKLIAVMLILSAVLAMGQRVEAKDMDSIGYLTPSGSTTLSWTEEEAYANEFIYMPFQVKKDGYVTFTASNTPENAGKNLGGTWFLCNSARKEISSTDDCGFWADDNITFAVKGGNSYFLKVKCRGYEEEMVIDHQYQEVNDKSGNKKSKACKLKKNKKAEGLLMAGESKVDWYKITLTKKQILKITIAQKSYRGLGMKVYDSKGDEVYGLNYWEVSSSDTLDDPETLSSLNAPGVGKSKFKKLPKGTYYIKIYTDKDARGCGYYSLKWK